MKKLLTLALALVLSLGLFACAKQEIVYPERVTLYLPDQSAIDAGGYGFVTKEIDMHMPNLDSLKAMQLIGTLVYEGALPEGCDALSFWTYNATLDMNAAFADALSSTGTLGETLLMGCLVNTMLTYFALDSITVTAEGGVLQTGHETYDYPLTFYGNSYFENAGEG